MNSKRRKEISKNIAALQEVSTKLEIIKDEIENIYNDEEEYFYNIPDNLEGSSRYETAEEAVDNLSEANSSLDDIDDKIQTTVDLLQEILDILSEAEDNMNNAIE